jgi:3-isopropylmalate dehydratase small subunit
MAVLQQGFAVSSAKRKSQFIDIREIGKLCRDQGGAMALESMCFAELQPDFREQVKPGDVVVRGREFQPSQPRACLRGDEFGIAAMVVESCDSVFIRKALNVVDDLFTMQRV